MCRTKAEVVACVVCSAPVSQTLGKGLARLYCRECIRKRYRAGASCMTCQGCGKVWMRDGPGRPAKWCSQQCRHAAEYVKRRKVTACRRCGEAFVSTTGRGRLCPQCHHWKPRCGTTTACVRCNKPFYCAPANRTQQFCSRQCLHETKKKWHACGNCGNLFSRRKYRANDRRQYCCVQCYWDAHGMDGTVAARLNGRWAGKTRKRCRKAGVPYDPTVTIQKVAERDAYQCQICGKQCNTSWLVHKASRKPHSRNRTIDHIVPIVAGVCGHEWHNVQCACLSCNVKKGSKWRFGQLRLL